jgi:glycosyltransferase involved in cell wall biosynthesis
MLDTCKVALARVKVSVIIPVYNAEKTLASCLESLAGQTYPTSVIEVIVVDDGSTDQTGAVAKRFPVKYLYQENQGPATARNLGAAASSGDILLFTDADCVPTANWVEEMVAPFHNREVMAVKGAYISTKREIVARFAQIEFEERFSLLAKAPKIDMVDTYSAGYRARIFAELGGFDTRFPVANNEDTELSYRMAARGFRMVFNAKALVCHLGHPDTVIRYAKLKYSRGYWRMVVYRQYPEKMLRDVYTPKSLKLQVATLSLLLGTLPAPFFWGEPGLFLVGAAMLLFSGSLVPFVWFSLRKDVVVGLCSPFLLTVRAAALAMGALRGSVHARL